MCTKITPAKTDFRLILHVCPRLTNSRNLTNSVMVTLPGLITLLCTASVSSSVIIYVVPLELLSSYSHLKACYLIPLC